MHKIQFVKLRDGAHTPIQGSVKAAGYDLYACLNEEVWIAPHCTEKIGTGIAIQPPQGYFGAIFARSGLATKQGLRPSNCVGVCDEDYTGEYIVALHNDTDLCKCVHNVPREELVNKHYLYVQNVLTFLPFSPFFSNIFVIILKPAIYSTVLYNFPNAFPCIRLY